MRSAWAKTKRVLASLLAPSRRKWYAALAAVLTGLSGSKVVERNSVVPVHLACAPSSTSPSILACSTEASTVHGWVELEFAGASLTARPVAASVIPGEFLLVSVARRDASRVRLNVISPKGSPVFIWPTGTPLQLDVPSGPSLPTLVDWKIHQENGPAISAQSERHDERMERIGWVFFFSSLAFSAIVLLAPEIAPETDEKLYDRILRVMIADIRGEPKHRELRQRMLRAFYIQEIAADDVLRLEAGMKKAEAMSLFYTAQAELLDRQTAILNALVEALS